LRRLARRVEDLTWRAATRVVAVTGVLKSMIAASGVPAQRIEVVPNGIDPAAFADLPVRPASADPLVLGFVGFVRDWHGLDAVIAAMASHGGTPRLDLVVVGDGPARAALEQQAAAAGIGHRVRFTGIAPHEAVPALVAGFDIALQPRAVAYASPLKIFDYMAAGRAIIAPDQPNIREILTHEATALLFDPADPAELWQAVVRLADDPVLRARLGKAARAEIDRRGYTWAGNAARLGAWADQDRGEPAVRLRRADGGGV